MRERQPALPHSLAAFIGHFLQPYKTIAFIFIFLALVAGFWGPINNILIKYVINVLPLAKDNVSVLTLPALLIVLNFIVFDNFTWRSMNYINYKYQGIIRNKVVGETLDHVLNHSHQFFQDNLSGRISSHIVTLADNLEQIIHRISMDLLRAVSLLFVSFITSYIVNPTFCYILLLWFLFFATFSIWMSRCLVPLADHFAEADSTLSGQLVDTISNQSNVRIFSNKPFELSRMDYYFGKLLSAFKRKEGFLVVLYCIQGGMIAIMMAFAVYYLVYFYQEGLVTIGDFALILGLSMELGHMMWYTMSRVDDFNQAYGKCRQSLNALMLPLTVQDALDAKELVCSAGKITFRNVRFHYKGATPLFQNKSIVIEGGQKVGLVGYSGGGKTSFINLILRLFDINEGAIEIDNQDIRHVTQDSLRQNIAMIPQDPTLFQRSLLENIRYGRIDATKDEVIEASKKAHAHEFIQKLPEHYQSLVGERGIKLSGGQRQRIAIARAILKNAPILILDEATSQLDSITEQMIQESLWSLMEGKTSIVIAHRLSTLLHMDRILVFNQGQIVEDGTHKELLAKNGLYKTLWESQVGGLLQDSKDSIH